MMVYFANSIPLKRRTKLDFGGLLCAANVQKTHLLKGPSMSDYPDFIRILSKTNDKADFEKLRFSLGYLIQILSWFNSDNNLDTIRMNRD